MCQVLESAIPETSYHWAFSCEPMNLAFCQAGLAMNGASNQGVFPLSIEGALSAGQGPALEFLSERVRQASLAGAAGVWAQTRCCLALAQRLRIGIGSLAVPWWHLAVLGLKVTAAAVSAKFPSLVLNSSHSLLSV